MNGAVALKPRAFGFSHKPVDPLNDLRQSVRRDGEARGESRRRIPYFPSCLYFTTYRTRRTRTIDRYKREAAR